MLTRRLNRVIYLMVAILLILCVLVGSVVIAVFVIIINITIMNNKNNSEDYFLGIVT